MKITGENLDLGQRTWSAVMKVTDERYNELLEYLVAILEDSKEQYDTFNHILAIAQGIPEDKEQMIRKSHVVMCTLYDQLLTDYAKFTPAEMLILNREVIDIERRALKQEGFPFEQLGKALKDIREFMEENSEEKKKEG